MLHGGKVDQASPYGGAHIAEEAADVLQQRALMLVVRLSRQAVSCLMLSAEQPASRTNGMRSVPAFRCKIGTASRYHSSKTK